MTSTESQVEPRWLPWQVEQAAAQRGGRLLPSLEDSWGVWDMHTQEWVAVDLDTERDARDALLVTDSLHPWELAVRQATEDDPDEYEPYWDDE